MTRLVAGCRRRVMWAGWGWVLSQLVLCVGCQSLGGGQGSAAVRDDVVAIQQYPPTVPWLWNEEGRINGMRTRVYLVSAKTEKGVFVPGTIKASLYALSRHPDRTSARELMHEWTFNERQAAGYRMRTASVMGCSYGLVLRWPADLDLAGCEIQLVFSYQRGDGKVIKRAGSRFRVPLPAGEPHLRAARRPARVERGNEARTQPSTQPHPKPGPE